LRERKDDIPLLVAHFLKEKVSPRTNHPFQVTRQSMALLCGHDWPGNVRELENAIERAATLCESDIIQAADLPPSLISAVQTSVPAESLEAPAPLPQVPESALYPLRTPDAEPAESSASSAQGSPQSFLSLKNYMREQELAYLNRALDQCGGDKEKAAILLGVSLATLYRKLAGEDKEA
jgi:DNA-binding NtrC family response regulator